MIQEAQQKKLDKVIAKACGDENFKKKLLSQPAATLKSEGVDLPAGMEVLAMENTGKIFHLVIPQKPGAGELADEELDVVSGGVVWNCKEWTSVGTKGSKATHH